MNAQDSEASSLARAALTQVDAFFDGVFAPLERWRPELIAVLRERLAAERLTGQQLTGQRLAAIVEAGAAGVLDTADRPIYGAGFCASDAVVSEGNPLAWWQGAERSLLASSTFGPGQAAIDLVRLEWYRVPESTGARHVAGPFVDYLCSNEITMTSSMPLIVDGTFWGVICADVLVSSLEDALVPMLSGIPAAALVNSGGRVVVSNDPDSETGDRHAAFTPATGDYAETVHTVRSERYPFTLVFA